MDCVRPQLRFKVSRSRRDFGAPVRFSDHAADEDSHKCVSFKDEKFSIRAMEKETGVQAIPSVTTSSAQTQW